MHLQADIDADTINIAPVSESSPPNSPTSPVSPRAARASSAEIKVAENVTLAETSGLLKLFLQSLPEPLLTTRLKDAFLFAAGLNNPQKSRAITLLVLELPAPQRDCLAYLMKVFADVAAQPTSELDIPHIASVFAPIILQGNASTGTLMDIKRCNEVLEVLMLNSDVLGVPPLDIIRKCHDNGS